MTENAVPFSCPVVVSRLPKTGLTVTFKADETERAALAGFHDLISLERFEGRLLLEPWRREGVRISGSVEACAEQRCVVTLEPVETVLAIPVDAHLVPEGSKLAGEAWADGGEIFLDPEGEDAPETFAGGRIDVGELASEFLALSLDPYPRKPGVSLPGSGEADDAAEKRQSPFAKLAALRRKH